MDKIVIYVLGGMVQAVYADTENLDVEVVDLDTEEGQANEAFLKEIGHIPTHLVW